MSLYLTTAAFRNAGFGVDLTPYSDAELRAILQGASNRVNTFTAAPNLPQPHDFRGGTITDERQIWHLWDRYTAQRRVWPMHKPVKTLTSLRILVTEQNYVLINPTDCFINNTDGYIEVVALTLGIGIFPVYANLSLSQPVASIGYTYGISYPVTGEELLETDGQTYMATNQWWDSAVTPKVYLNGALQNSGYTIDYDEGTVIFSADLDADDVVTADYNYTLQPAIARATGVIAADMIAQSNLQRRGMGGISRLHVAEIDIARAPVAVQARSVPDEAAMLLEPFVFRSV